MPWENTIEVRKGIELNTIALSDFIKSHLGNHFELKEVRQFSGGYSNLTYLLITNGAEWVLRKPPPGVFIKTAHDMGREYTILKKLKPHFNKIPAPLVYCKDESILGSPFYIMEKIQGGVLRVENLKIVKPTFDDFSKLSKEFVSLLVQLHQLDPVSTGLIDLGKPEGYIERQVTGWIARYEKSATDQIPEMEFLSRWLSDHMEHDNKMALIHNDFKYDNLILNEECMWDIKAVVDWEMATVGHPFMDVGTCLAYWTEDNDPVAFRNFNTTWLPGNYTRKQWVEEYENLAGVTIDNVEFFCAFGLYKVAVIAQQIYARYKQGIANDSRFGTLIHIIQGAAHRGVKTIQNQSI